jgi:hypothetical protein
MMFIMSDDPKHQTADWVNQLHHEITEAAALVEKIQKALCRAGDLTPEIVLLTHSLEYRVGVALGHWEEYQKSSRAGFGTYCLAHADNTYVRRDGVSVLLSAFSAEVQTEIIDGWWADRLGR